MAAVFLLLSTIYALAARASLARQQEKTRALAELNAQMFESVVGAVFVLSVTLLLAMFLMASSHRAQLQRLVETDPLTGLLNRAGAVRRIQAYMDRHPGSPVTEALLDIDDFKLVNDLYGHDIGDEALKNLGKNLNQVFGGRQASWPASAGTNSASSCRGGRRSRRPLSSARPRRWIRPSPPPRGSAIPTPSPSAAPTTPPRPTAGRSWSAMWTAPSTT